MPTASTTQQNQSGSDVSTSQRGGSSTISTRTEPASTVTTTNEQGSETSETVTNGSTTRTAQKELIGCTITFTLKVTGNPPPKPLSS